MKPISNPAHEAKESPGLERREHRLGRELDGRKQMKGGKLGRGGKGGMVKTPAMAPAPKGGSKTKKG